MDDFMKFEEYIDGNLSVEEIQEFLIQTELNPEFDSELSFRAEVNEALRDKSFFELKKLTNSKFNNPLSGSKFGVQKDILKTWHLAAASFALILVVGGLWYILSNNSFSTERLVSKYYKPAHPILQFRSVEVNADDALKEAFNFYQQNDYTNALKYFNTLENQITAKFYSGVCYIELEQYGHAIRSFEYVINDNDNLFVEQAEWYLGLIYLMNNQKTLAIDQFNRISESDSYYSNQAVEILKYLN
jgi:tetratricopeptide (TPR) repeat protein